jgi:hypothetical protein
MVFEVKEGKSKKPEIKINTLKTLILDIILDINNKIIF